MKSENELKMSEKGLLWTLMTKMECENESENDHFCESKGSVQFFKNGSFSSHSEVHSWEMRLKWAKNEKMATVNNPNPSQLTFQITKFYMHAQFVLTVP